MIALELLLNGRYIIGKDNQDPEFEQYVFQCNPLEKTATITLKLSTQKVFAGDTSAEKAIAKTTEYKNKLSQLAENIAHEFKLNLYEHFITIDDRTIKINQSGLKQLVTPLANDPLKHQEIKRLLRFLLDLQSKENALIILTLNEMLSNGYVLYDYHPNSKQPHIYSLIATGNLMQQYQFTALKSAISALIKIHTSEIAFGQTTQANTQVSHATIMLNERDHNILLPQLSSDIQNKIHTQILNTDSIESDTGTDSPILIYSKLLNPSASTTAPVIHTLSSLSEAKDLKPDIPDNIGKTEDEIKQFNEQYPILIGLATTGRYIKNNCSDDITNETYVLHYDLKNHLIIITIEFTRQKTTTNATIVVQQQNDEKIYARMYQSLLSEIIQLENETEFEIKLTWKRIGKNKIGTQPLFIWAAITKIHEFDAKLSDPLYTIMSLSNTKKFIKNCLIDLLSGAIVNYHQDDSVDYPHIYYISDAYGKLIIGHFLRDLLIAGISYITNPTEDDLKPCQFKLPRGSHLYLAIKIKHATYQKLQTFLSKDLTDDDNDLAKQKRHKSINILSNMEAEYNKAKQQEFMLSIYKVSSETNDIKDFKSAQNCIDDAINKLYNETYSRENQNKLCKIITDVFTKLYLQSKNHTLLIDEMCDLFDYINNPLRKCKMNLHRNQWLDWLLGIENTQHWQDMVKKIRVDAYQLLKALASAPEIKKNDPQNSISYIKSYMNRAIFVEHRHTFPLISFTQTHTAQLLARLIEELEVSCVVEDKTNTPVDMRSGN